MTRGLVLMSWLVASGCSDPASVSPQPQPVPGSMKLHAEQITASVDGSSLVLSGAAGASDLVSSTLFAIDLDGSGPEVSTPTDDTGAFVLELPGALGHRVRLQAGQGLEISHLLDLSVDASSLALTVVPEDACAIAPLESAPASGLVNTNQAAHTLLPLQAKCGAPVTIDSVTLRNGASGFSFDGVPTSVAPELEATIGIGFVNASAGSHRDLLQIRTTPSTAQASVTLHVLVSGN